MTDHGTATGRLAYAQPEWVELAKEAMAGWRRLELQRWEAAAVFGLALAKRCDAPDVHIYQSQAWHVPTDQSVLRMAVAIGTYVGGGTMTMQTLAHTYDGHDRVVILTDEQAHPGTLPQIGKPIYTFNLGGYQVAQMRQGEHGSYAFGGLTDAGFRMIEILEQRRDARWPFVAA